MRIFHWTSGTVVRHAALAAACAAGFVASVDCNPGGGGTTPPPTTASSSVSFRMFASGAPKCTADLRFEWAPISVTPSGTAFTAAFTVPPSGFTHYDVLASSSGDPETPSTCDFNADALKSLALGKWQLTLVDAVIGPMAQCTVTLRAGANWAAFRQGIAACKETPPGSIGFEYP